MRPEACVEQLKHGSTARELIAVNEMAGGLQNATVHAGIVVTGGDDQVAPGDEAVAIHFVVM
jgi:hypothetical protein